MKEWSICLHQKLVTTTDMAEQRESRGSGDLGGRTLKREEAKMLEVGRQAPRLYRQDSPRASDEQSNAKLSLCLRVSGGVLEREAHRLALRQREEPGEGLLGGA